MLFPLPTGDTAQQMDYIFPHIAHAVLECDYFSFIGNLLSLLILYLTVQDSSWKICMTPSLQVADFLFKPLLVCSWMG